MKTVTITAANAMKAFKNANAETKTMLTNLLGEEVLSTNIFDRVKTLDDVYSELGERPFLENSLTPDEIAYKQAKLIAKALNEGWVPDWSNESQYKYYPWMKFVAGVGWSCDDCASAYTYSTVGSRLVFKDVKTCKYAVETFPEVYNHLFN